MQNLMLAEINGSGIVHNLVIVLLIGICVGIVYWVGSYFIRTIPLPGLAGKIWDGLFILLGMLVVVNFLLGLAGWSVVKW